LAFLPLITLLESRHANAFSFHLANIYKYTVTSPTLFTNLKPSLQRHNKKNLRRHTFFICPRQRASHVHEATPCCEKKTRIFLNLLVDFFEIKEFFFCAQVVELFALLYCYCLLCCPCVHWLF
jgi:hypothetical protein